MDKSATILELFGQCTHQEQLRLMQEMDLYLRRDFIAFLPAEVVEKVLVHLPLPSVLTCLSVSKSWYGVVMACNGYWRRLCERSGLSGKRLVLEGEVLGGYKAVACSLLRQEKNLDKYVSFTESFDFEGGSKSLVNIPHKYTLVRPVCNGFCVRVEKTVSPSLTLLRVEDQVVHEVAKVEDIFPHGYFDIKWCTSLANSVLLLGNNGVWVEFLLPADTPTSAPVVTQWQESSLEVLSNSWYSRCRNCLLVVAMTGLMTNKMWDFHISALQKNPAIIHSSQVAKRFLPEFVAGDYDYNSQFFRAHKIHVYPSDGGCGCGTLCRDHKMLVQFGSAVVQFEITKHREGFEISNPLRELVPYGDPTHYLDQYIIGKFAFSHDESLLAVMEIDDHGMIHSHTWNLAIDDADPFVVTVPTDQAKRVFSLECVAVGYLYQLIVVEKFTGTDELPLYEVLVLKGIVAGEETRIRSFKVGSFTGISGVHLHACGGEGWLNSLSKWPFRVPICISGTL